jgi:hypothetical protein
VEKIPIRYDRALKPEWLDYAVDQAIKAPGDAEYRTVLKEYIQPRVIGANAKTKTITQLIRVAGTTSPISRDRLEEIQMVMTRSAPEDRTLIRLHLLMEACPFFNDCVSAIRKLAVLGQEDVAVAQLYERLVGLYGDRDIVPRSVRNVLTTLLWLGLVKNCDHRWVPADILLTKM